MTPDMSGSEDKAGTCASVGIRHGWAIPHTVQAARQVGEFRGFKRWGVRFSNPAMFLPQKPEDFRGFQRGWSIAQVARFGESGARESRFRLPFRLRIRQPVRENRGKPAPHGAARRQGDDSRRVLVA